MAGPGRRDSVDPSLSPAALLLPRLPACVAAARPTSARSAPATSSCVVLTGMRCDTSRQCLAGEELQLLSLLHPPMTRRVRGGQVSRTRTARARLALCACTPAPPLCTPTRVPTRQVACHRERGKPLQILDRDCSPGTLCAAAATAATTAVIAAGIPAATATHAATLAALHATRLLPAGSDIATPPCASQPWWSRMCKLQP